MINYLKSVLYIVPFIFFAAEATAEKSPNIPSIHIKTDSIAAEMSPMLYGLMTEEINFSYEGGVYGELIRNRSFKAQAGIAYQNEEPVYWKLFGPGELSLDHQNGLNGALDTSLLINASNATESFPVGASNYGYWGIPLHPKTRYTVSFYAKADGIKGPISVALEKQNGKQIVAAQVGGITNDWKKFDLTLETENIAPSKDNRLVLKISEPGKLWIQQVSLFGPTYKNRRNGNRPDLMQMMADLKPAFLRFPGGNYLEGDYFGQRFDWKKTIGPLESRPGHRSPWNYWSTDGMGLMEFLLWCEDLNMEPVLGVFAGYALQGEHLSSEEELAPHIQDALDEIEFITGDTNSKWGAKRASLGHPKPFTLRYVEIGNEDFFDKSNTYDKRFALFYKAIKVKYPQLQLISTVAANATPSQRPDLIDEHTYGWGEEDMYRHMSDYDNRSRKEPKVFIGEWATHNGWPMPDMKAAIADAAYLTSLERNSDHVVMSAYAPMLANVSHIGGSSLNKSMQWAVNLIGYDALNAYGTPSYYVLKMFAESKGDVVLASQGLEIPQWQFKDLTVPSLYWVVTKKRANGHIQIKMANRGANKQPINIALDGTEKIASVGTMTVLSSNDPDAGNSLESPEKIKPQTYKYKGISNRFVLTVPAYSVSVLDFYAD